MCAALDILGFRSYHWNEVLSNKNNGHLQLWLQAVQAKYDGIGKPFEGEDFDRMLWDYDVPSPFLSLAHYLCQSSPRRATTADSRDTPMQSVSDEPCCLFVPELAAAYPSAKVILTTRTRDSWLRSYRNSILEVL